MKGKGFEGDVTVHLTLNDSYLPQRTGREVDSTMLSNGGHTFTTVTRFVTLQTH